MARSLKSVPEMTKEIAAEKERNGYTKRLYKAASDEHKGEALASDILKQANGLIASYERGKVDFNNMQEVKARTIDYLTACAAAESFPSVMGLSVHGFGISRQALNAYLKKYPRSAASEFITMTKDIMADILTNASLYNNANAVQALFQLKNHFEHADRVEVQPITGESTADEQDINFYIGEILKRDPDKDLTGLSEGEIKGLYIIGKYGLTADLEDSL